MRRLLVKTRTKTNTLSGGSAHVELLPNGTVRSAKSEAVEMASDFQKKRQRTLQNVELQKQRIEEMFKGKGSNSSIVLRHSNGYGHANILNASAPADTSDHAAEGEPPRVAGSLRYSASAFYPSRRFSKNNPDNNNNTTTNNANNSNTNSPIISNSTTNNTATTTNKQDSPRSIYFVKPTTVAHAYNNHSPLLIEATSILLPPPTFFSSMYLLL